MRKLGVFLLFLSFVLLAGITAYAAMAATDRPLDSKAVCSQSQSPTERPKCDPLICPPTDESGCPRTDCDTRNGLCCYQCPGSPFKRCR